MKKKQKKYSALLFTTIMTLSSTVPVMAFSVPEIQSQNPTFISNPSLPTFIQPINDSSILIAFKQREKVLLQTIDSPTFKKLDVDQRIFLLKEYFSLKKDFYKDNQGNILFVHDSMTLQAVKDVLIQDSQNQGKDFAFIQSIIQEIQQMDMSKLSNERKQILQKYLRDLIQTCQDVRREGRDLNTLLNMQMKNKNQFELTNTFGSKFVKESEEDSNSLEYQLKKLKETNGSPKIYKKVTELLNQQQKKYFFVNNEVIELTTPFIKLNHKNYIEIAELSKISGFEFYIDDHTFMYKNGEDVLTISRDDLSVQFNGVQVGQRIPVIQQDKMYLPLRSVLELFHYDVVHDSDLDCILVEKQVYKENEIDNLSVDEFVHQLIPDITVNKEEEK